MALDLIISGNFKQLIASKNFNCFCCNADGSKGERGIIKEGTHFIYANFFTQYVTRYDSQLIIPRKFRDKEGAGLDAWQFKKPAKIHKVCMKCFDDLKFLASINTPGPFQLDILYDFKSRQLYYNCFGSSQKPYHCTCCGKPLPVGSTYVRFGKGQEGCTCMECFDIFKHLE